MQKGFFTPVSFRQTLAKAKWLLVWYGLFLLASAAFVFSINKGSSFRYLTQNHTAGADSFFKYFTHFGDGLFVLALCVVFLIQKKYYQSLLIFITYVVSGILSQVIKNVVLADRPQLYFSKLGQTIHEVPGVKMYTIHSFPSGHTTTAFALAIMLALIYPGKPIHFLFLAMAIGVGFSRIYLGQHFPIDVWAGACLGVMSSLLVFFLFSRVYSKPLL